MFFPGACPWKNEWVKNERPVHNLWTGLFAFLIIRHIDGRRRRVFVIILAVLIVIEMRMWKNVIKGILFALDMEYAQFVIAGVDHIIHDDFEVVLGFFVVGIEELFGKGLVDALTEKGGCDLGGEGVFFAACEIAEMNRSITAVADVLFQEIELIRKNIFLIFGAPGLM
ncbi:MAG: hypothetical protein IIV85_02700, partial [Clostridia bacterium]|nr:hypothetical protein [Clostridia bacterium]